MANLDVSRIDHRAPKRSQSKKTGECGYVMNWIFCTPFALLLVILGICAVDAQASEVDARNIITIATGSVPTEGDRRILTVAAQLQEIREFCIPSSSGGTVADKLAKSHSLLKVSQPLLPLLKDFVRVAAAQCSRFSDTMLMSLYVLERNDGAAHSTTVNRLVRDPNHLVKKWNSR